MTLFPTGEGDQGATNPADPNPDATEDSQAASGDLSPETVAALVVLARVIDPEVCDGPDRTVPVAEAAEVWRRQDAALLTAKRLWDAGFRLVVDDDTTVELMADAMSSKTSVPIAMQDEQTARFYRRMARAAVRALREEQA